MLNRLRLVKALVPLTIALAFLAGCATYQPADVTSHYDTITGLRTDLMDGNLLDGGTEPRELIWLNASRVYDNYTDYTYYLELTYMAREEVGYLEIPPGQNLVLTINQEIIPLAGTGSLNARKTTSEGLQVEKAIYKVSKLLLQKIAIAHSVRVAVKGNNGVVEREFNEENFDKFKRFVTRYAL